MHQDHELLAADPHQALLFQQDLVDRGHEVAQRAVAVARADLVVDALEAVEVEQGQRERAAIVADGLEHARHALQQPGAVGQPGEAVIAGQLHQPLHAIDDRRGQHAHHQDQDQPLDLGGQGGRAVVDRDQAFLRGREREDRGDEHRVLHQRQSGDVQGEPAIVAQRGHGDGDQVKAPHDDGIGCRHRVAQREQHQHHGGHGDVVAAGGVGQPAVTQRPARQREPDLCHEVDEHRQAEPDHYLARSCPAQGGDQRHGQDQQRQHRAQARDQQFAARAEREHDLVGSRQQPRHQSPQASHRFAHVFPRS